MAQATIDYQRCRPSDCENGLCRILRECPVKAIWQEEPYEVPVADWSRCRGCSKCLTLCPHNAVGLIR